MVAVNETGHEVNTGVEVKEMVQDFGKELVFYVTSDFAVAVSSKLDAEDPKGVRRSAARLMVRRFEAELKRELGIE